MQLLKVDPPSEVIAAFRDVQAARADQERLQNEAQTYANRVIPEARGQASQITEAAIAYRDRIIAEAQGQADRFTQVYESYAAAPEVTRRRMYLETMEEIFANINKIIIDEKAAAAPASSPTCRSTSSSRNEVRSTAGAKLMKRGIFGGVGLIIVAVIGFLAYLSVFIVDQTQQALVLRFGQRRCGRFRRRGSITSCR